MLTVDDYERIRRLVIVEGLSQREVARRLAHSRKTVRKALDYSVPPGYRRSEEAMRPVIDGVKHLIEAWLEQDRSHPPKQRHTGQRIYERLRDEYGFRGSASAVRRYVAWRKATCGEVYLPLKFEPGEEAQVDWGEAWCVLGGRQRKVFLFCMRLCYSTASFVRAYERENQESLLDGHVRAFEFLGGVPRRIAYDNLRSAVITVGKAQERRLTQKFRELRSHYLFQTRFCSVGRGNEKGHVENLVKLTQRKFMTPVPEFGGFEELNAHLEAECTKDMDRQVARTSKTRRQLLEEDREGMLGLGSGPFQACKELSTFATKQALVRLDTNDYSVPVQYAYHQVCVKGFVDRVELNVAGQLVATHPRHYGSGEFILDPYHYIPLLERKPGGLHNGRPFKGEPWGGDFTRMRTELAYRYGGEGTRKFIRILLLFTEFAVEDVKDAVSVCLKRRAYSDEAVRGVLTYEARRPYASLDLSERPELQLSGDGRRPASLYDALMGEGAPV